MIHTAITVELHCGEYGAQQELDAAADRLIKNVAASVLASGAMPRGSYVTIGGNPVTRRHRNYDVYPVGYESFSLVAFRELPGDREEVRLHEQIRCGVEL